MTWQDTEQAAEIIESAPITPSVQGLVGAFTDGDISSADLTRLWTEVGLPIVKAIVLILIVVFVAGWLGRMTTRVAKKAHIEITLARFFGNLMRYLFLVVGGISILGVFGIETTSFAAILAAVGFAVGMALSGTLSNVASGVMLLVFRPFKVGDVVSAGGVTGKIEELGLFTTVFDTPDNRRIIVPNNAIFGSTIENVTFHDTRRVDVSLGTDYGADLDKTRAVLMEAATKVEGRLQDQDAVVVLGDLGDSAIGWAVRVWANTSDYWAVKEQLTRDVKVALDNAGIGIPFPQMDVHLHKQD
jgi:small conductance mechanosensitive channel